MSAERDRLMSQLRAKAETIAEIVAAAAAGRDTYGGDDDGYLWSDYPLEVIAERGRPFTVTLSVGGPHVEVVADGYYDARLVGYSAGETVTLWDDAEHTLTRFLELFINRDETEPGR